MDNAPSPLFFDNIEIYEVYECKVGLIYFGLLCDSMGIEDIEN